MDESNFEENKGCNKLENWRKWKLKVKARG